MSYEALHLDPDEKVIMEVRKHWIVFARYAISLLFSAFLPFIIFTLIQIFLPQLLKIILPGNQYALFAFLYCIWLLLLWLSFFVNWTKYYLDVWYVTEERIIAVDQKKIFTREVSNIRFDKVQDVKVDIRGFIATFLDFGNIKVQTASEDNREFYISVVRHPDEVRKVIFNQQNINNRVRTPGL